MDQKKPIVRVEMASVDEPDLVYTVRSHFVSNVLRGLGLLTTIWVVGKPCLALQNMFLFHYQNGTCLQGVSFFPKRSA